MVLDESVDPAPMPHFLRVVGDIRLINLKPYYQSRVRGHPRRRQVNFEGAGGQRVDRVDIVIHPGPTMGKEKQVSQEVSLHNGDREGTEEMDQRRDGRVECGNKGIRSEVSKKLPPGLATLVLGTASEARRAERRDANTHRILIIRVQLLPGIHKLYFHILLTIRVCWQAESFIIWVPRFPSFR